jgi:hypothetical protein
VALGGTLEAESQAGVFRLTATVPLPVPGRTRAHDCRCRAVAGGRRMSDRASGRIRVLLADDEAPDPGEVAALLSYEDTCCRGGGSLRAEALAMARAHRPDVAVLDLQMPPAPTWKLGHDPKRPTFLTHTPVGMPSTRPDGGPAVTGRTADNQA